MNECVLLTSSGRGIMVCPPPSPRNSLYWTRVRFDGSNHPLFSRKCPLVTTGYSDTCGHACMLCACFLGGTLPNCSTRSAKMKQNIKNPFPVVGNLRGFSDFPRRCVKTRFELMWRGPGKRFLYSPGPPRGAAKTGVYRPSPPCGSRGPQRLSLPEDAVYPPPAGLPPPPGAAGVAGVDLPEESVNQSRRRLSGALVVVVQHLSIESAAGEEKNEEAFFSVKIGRRERARDRSRRQRMWCSSARVTRQESMDHVMRGSPLVSASYVHASKSSLCAFRNGPPIFCCLHASKSFVC